LFKKGGTVFDIGFSEIIVCAVVALIVIGPERLPETVRTVGLWMGRIKRSLRDTREEIERQMGVDDIRRQLHNEEIMRSLEDARRDINSVIDQSHNSLQEPARVYTSEPDLPDHAHMHEQGHQTEKKIEPSTASVTTTNDITPTETQKTHP
jgi:sec-independent protein translocase protein TatB